MASLADFEQFIADHKDLCDVGPAVQNSLIDRAEIYLGLTLPEEYREFLRHWSTVSIGYIEIYGITSDRFDNGSGPNAIWLTKHLRDKNLLPANYIIIYDDEGDEYWCLDTSDSSKSRTVVMDVGTKRLRPQATDEFWDFLLEKANEVVQTISDE